MWFEAIPSIVATGTCLYLVELSPMITHYISWGCPMMRNSCGELSTLLVQRDQRIAEEEHGIKHFAQHMYTFGLSGVSGKVKEKGNWSKYAEAEKKFEARRNA